MQKNPFEIIAETFGIQDMVPGDPPELIITKGCTLSICPTPGVYKSIGLIFKSFNKEGYYDPNFNAFYANLCRLKIQVFAHGILERPKNLMGFYEVHYIAAVAQDYKKAFKEYCAAYQLPDIANTDWPPQLFPKLQP